MLGIVIGHSVNSTGAKNRSLNINEYTLNLELANEIHEACKKENISSQIIHRKNGYQALPKNINDTMVDFCISVHHNGFSDKNTNGTETLYYHKSKISKKFARAVNNRMVEELNFKNRDIHGVDSESRGGYVLKYTAMPCILIEPYFMTNNKAVEQRDPKKLAAAIVKGYIEFLSKI